MPLEKQIAMHLLLDRMEMPASSRSTRKMHALQSKQMEEADIQRMSKPAWNRLHRSAPVSPVLQRRYSPSSLRPMGYSGDESARPGNQKTEPRDAARPFSRRRSTERARHLDAGVGSAPAGSAGIALLFGFHATSKARHPTVTWTEKTEQTNRQGCGQGNRRNPT
jgi:hypothetical protein